MSLKSRIASVPGVRQAAIHMLRATARDITRRNPWTGDALTLNTFKHKGYWFYGQEREADTMRRLADIVRPGDTIWEVGGHIGFITQHFSRCTGSDGRVVVFEPGRNNLPYLRANTSALSNVEIVEQAVGAAPGSAQFFEDNISGQNNSLLTDYHAARSTARTHGIELKKTAYSVEVVTLDDHLGVAERAPDVIKIDIEGGELDALRSATRTLALARCLMVEITENRDDVVSLLREAGFSLTTPDGEPLAETAAFGNVFALRGDPAA
jgi:FkbM family methyltransferase